MIPVFYRNVILRPNTSDEKSGEKSSLERLGDKDLPAEYCIDSSISNDIQF